MSDTSAALLPKARKSVKSDIVAPSNRNSDIDWNEFDPDAYEAHNYRTLRDDDRQIIGKIRDYFASAGVSEAHGIDVGTGPNLYPALALLPFCDSLELRELSTPNVAWLGRQIKDYDDNWDQFWEVYRHDPRYAQVVDPRARLADVASVRQASVFDLPARAFDVGTMFFLACSLSADIAEFRTAVHCFVRSLRPNAPFAAAFMEESEGYPAGDAWFPAVGIHSEEVSESLASVAYDIRIDRITAGGTPLRDGYSGAMLIAVGRTAG
jgi:hypothetical protein